jgi:hypothetical protein
MFWVGQSIGRSAIAGKPYSKGDAALYTISGAAELLLVSLPYYIDSLVLLFKFVFAGVEFRIDPVLPYIITIS